MGKSYESYSRKRKRLHDEKTIRLAKEGRARGSFLSAQLSSEVRDFDPRTADQYFSFLDATTLENRAFFLDTSSLQGPRSDRSLFFAYHEMIPHFSTKHRSHAERVLTTMEQSVERLAVILQRNNVYITQGVIEELRQYVQIIRRLADEAGNKIDERRIKRPIISLMNICERAYQEKPKGELLSTTVGQKMRAIIEGLEPPTGEVEPPSETNKDVVAIAVTSALINQEQTRIISHDYGMALLMHRLSSFLSTNKFSGGHQRIDEVNKRLDIDLYAILLKPNGLVPKKEAHIWHDFYF